MPCDVSRRRSSRRDRGRLRGNLTDRSFIRADRAARYCWWCCGRSSRSQCAHCYGFRSIFRYIITCGCRIVILPIFPWDFPSCYDSAMSNLVILFVHFLATLARLLGPRGVRSIVAESLIRKHQLLIVARSRQRSPNLCTSDRILAGLMALLVRPTRLLRSAIVLKPSTLLGLHKALSKQKYRVLFSPNRRRKPGPKGPSAELIRAVVEMKQRNPNWGCPRIAQQIALAFHIQINKDVVRRILGHHYQPGHSSGGPSWQTFLGHMKDSLWSMERTTHYLSSGPS